ncbi:MAG TPA: DUF2867 domain-containing protein [Anaerolineales bacterium]|nr:DUF2867 domain-containing protein [Anaerolineales bacterium]
MINGPVLVTGANGFIASRLIPRLLKGGYTVRVLARSPRTLEGRAWLPEVEVYAGSTSDEASLAAALQGVHTAYYLVHNMSRGHGYVEIERQSARRFAEAAALAGVQHIIYLGGLADPKDPHLAPHMRSRIETGQILRLGKVPVTEFRAGVIAGAGSISFEMVRFLTECFPILPGPLWLRNRAQPIASENVIDYLLSGLEKPEARGGIYEMGGPEQMPFGDVMLRYARHRGLKRYLFMLPGIPIGLMALIVDRLTPVPRPIATALIGGLQSDSRVLDGAAQRMFPEVQLLTFEQAIQIALSELIPERLERVWVGRGQDAGNIRHEGFIVDYRSRTVNAPAEKVFASLMQMRGPRQWASMQWMWRLRGWMDRLVKGQATHAMAESNAHDVSDSMHPRELKVGAVLDYYEVEALELDRLIRMRSLLRAPGSGWLEWRIDPEAAPEGTARLTQTAFFAPRGLPGFLYWLVVGPFHRMALRGLIESIRKQSEAG